ncbi:MAG TPA: thioredoxin [Nitrososphaerales archaeon]|nr:thioredoxin [Nitrososphaerales archaeon]
MTESVRQINGSAFEQEVEKAQSPVVVDFYADWCGPCKMVAPVIEQLSQQYEGRAKFVKVNTDENQELAMKFGIMSIPTVMFFMGGKVKDVVIGVAPAAVFKQKLDSAISA